MSTSFQQFRSAVRCAVPVETLFDWHERRGAFERLSPPWSPPRVVERVGGIREGARVVLDVPAGPFSIRWVIVHRDYIRHRQFRDVMLRGPFSHFEHTHSFHADGPGESVLDDSIDYALPFGIIGHLAGGWYARASFQRVFRYRHTLMLNDLARHAQFADRGSLKIAVTGASGFIGSQLSAFLSTGGHQVLRIGRGSVQPGVVDVSWDPERGMLDPRALEQVDAVVHLAGTNIAERWTAKHRAEIRNSRVAGTRLLARTLAQLEQKPRVLVSGSAIGIYGNRGDEVLDETSAVGQGFLVDVVREWEASTEAAQAAGVRVVLTRTGIVQGAAGGALAKQLPFFRAGLGGPLAGGKDWVSPIALDDVVGAMHACLMRDDIAGPVNLVSPTPVTNGDYTRMLGTVLRRPAFWPIPALAVRVMFGREMADNTVLSSLRVVPSVLERAGFEFRHPTLEGMLRFTLGASNDDA